MSVLDHASSCLNTDEEAVACGAMPEHNESPLRWVKVTSGGIRQSTLTLICTAVGGGIAICVFAFNCHMNVVPVTSDMVRPTQARIRKIGWRVNSAQASLYCVIAAAGNLSFVEDTCQNILNCYSKHDIFIILGRVLLSLAMFVTLPMNFIPTMQSGMRLLAACFGGRVAERREDRPEAVCKALVAVAVPGIAVVLSLLGGTICTAMMMIIPAFCIRATMPRSVKNGAKQAFLLSFAVLSFASVPISVLRLTGVMHP